MVDERIATSLESLVKILSMKATEILEPHLDAMMQHVEATARHASASAETSLQDIVRAEQRITKLESACGMPIPAGISPPSFSERLDGIESRMYDMEQRLEYLEMKERGDA